MADISQVESQIRTARQKLAEKREQAASARKKLSQAKEALPKIRTQQALRNKFAGLQGRMSRRKVIGAEKEIASKRGVVEGFEKELTRYEKESIEPVEVKVREYKAEQRAIETVQKFISKGKVGLLAIYGEGRERELAQDYVKQKRLQTESINELTEKINKEGLESLTDFEKKRFDAGVKSGIFSWKEEAKDIKTDLPKFDNVKTDVFKSPDTSITDRKKFGAKITGFFTSGLIPTVSAKNLSTPDNLLSNESNVSSGNSMGVSGSLGSRITGFVSNIVGDKKDFNRGTEIFNQDRNIVTAATYPSGQGSVSFVRSFTPDETKRFEQLNKNILTIDTKELSRRQKNIATSDKTIKDLSSNINEVGEWTGSESDLERYNRAVGNIQDTSKINVGIGKFSRQRDIREFDLNRPVSTVKKAVIGTVAETSGVALEKGLKAANIKEVQARQLFFAASPIAGAIPSSVTLTPEQAGKVQTKTVQTGLDLGSYAVPVAGQALFFAEGAELANVAGIQKRETGAISKEVKKEALFFVGALATAGALKGASALKQVRMFGKPSRIKTSVEITPLTKAKVKVSPKPVVVETEVGKRLKVTKSGTTLEFSPSGNIITTTEKGRGLFGKYMSVQKQDPTGRVVGIIEKESLLGKKLGKTYTTKFIDDPIKGTRTFETFKDGKLIRTGELTRGKNLLGLTQQRKITSSKVSRNTISPQKEVTSKAVKEEGFLQEIIPIRKGIKVENGKILSKLKTSEITNIQPAKSTFIARLKSGKQRVDLIAEGGRKTAKQSSQGSFNLLKIGEEKKITEKITGKGIVYYESPTFEQRLYTSLDGGGEFIIKKQGALDRFAERQLKQVQKPSGILFTSLTPSPPTGILTGINAPTASISRPKISTKFLLEPKFEREIVKSPLAKLDSGRKTENLEVMKIEQPVKIIERLQAKVSQQPITQIKSKTQLKSEIQPRTSLKENIKQEQPVKQQLNLIQRVVQKQTPRQNILKQPQKPKQTKEPIKPVKPKIITPSQKTSTLPKKKGTIFEILQVIKGKKKKTGESEDLLLATKKLVKGLKGGLQASGFIVEKGTGKKVKASRLLGALGGEFRVGKSDPFKVVERKEKRLRKTGTGKQIQMFRKKGSKKRSNLLGGL
jgi:hypothetical protein